MPLSFLDRVAELYGNKRSQWCDKRLEPRQKVKILWEITGEPRFVDGVAIGRIDKKTGNNIVRIVNPDTGRHQTMKPLNRNILVRW